MAAIAAACSGHGGGHARGSTTTSPSGRPEVAGTALVTFESSPTGVTFRHPREWLETKYERVSSFTSLLTYLSNVKLHDPCTRSYSGGGETITCGDPVGALPTRGVLVSWSNIGFPHGRGEAELPTVNARIDGRPAYLTVERPGTCSRLGANETITADIARPAGNHYEMVACLRGPGVVQAQRLVNQMLASVRVSA
jgi:hypothetical protein